jgi:Inhibitor of Apoptosis domain
MWETDRVNTFYDWPINAKQSKEQLAKAGFYYVGEGDRVIWFSCGGGLKDWEEHHQPWEEHAKYYSECEYQKLMKGPGYIFFGFKWLQNSTSHPEKKNN